LSTRVLRQVVQVVALRAVVLSMPYVYHGWLT
jgi:hypothetical protein